MPEVGETDEGAAAGLGPWVVAVGGGACPTEFAWVAGTAE